MAGGGDARVLIAPGLLYGFCQLGLDLSTLGYTGVSMLHLRLDLLLTCLGRIGDNRTTLWSMARSKTCTPHPTLCQAPQKMRLHILCKGVSAKAGPGNSCWGHRISRPWKLSKSQETSLGRGTWPVGHMHHRKTRPQRGKSNHIHCSVLLRVHSAPPSPAPRGPR